MPPPDKAPELEGLGGKAMHAAIDKYLSVFLESTSLIQTASILEAFLPGKMHSQKGHMSVQVLCSTSSVKSCRVFPYSRATALGSLPQSLLETHNACYQSTSVLDIAQPGPFSAGFRQRTCCIGLQPRKGYAQGVEDTTWAIMVTVLLQHTCSLELLKGNHDRALANSCIRFCRIGGCHVGRWDAGLKAGWLQGLALVQASGRIEH